MKNNVLVLYDAHNRPVPLSRMARRTKGQAKAMLTGFKGANDENLQDWAFLPLDIKTILRNDLRKLRARSRDLARNDDAARRFLFLLKQNVLGHTGIKLQAKNRLRNDEKLDNDDTARRFLSLLKQNVFDYAGTIFQAKNKLRNDKSLDKKWNAEIEREWNLFGKKRRYRGQFESPSACGQFTMRELSWLSLWNRAIDGECFIQLLKGYPHNRHRFAVRFLNPDLLDSSYCIEHKNGNRIEMGIEFDEFDRPVAYHFNKEHPNRKLVKRLRIPASQIIHIFRKEYVGQIRGVPDFAAVMHKAKMLNGVHEAVVVGWRVAAAKMGFFTPKEEDDPDPLDTGEKDENDDIVIEATPGSFEVLQSGYDFHLFDPQYPSSTYESGHQVFMQQMANGLNVSSPTLSNNYAKVNYSSLRQALLEDREGWRCVQAEEIDGFYQPLFDEWYDWTLNITGRIKISESKRSLDPVIVWQPRGWPWVDPEKEVNAQIKAINANFRTRQGIIAETSGADFIETADVLKEEKDALEERGLKVYVSTNPSSIQPDTNNNDDESKGDNDE